MKYYSTILNRVFDTVEELERIEAEYLREKQREEEAKRAEEERKANLKAQREARAKEVEQAIQEVQAAQKKANKLLNDFCKDYGVFHTSLKGTAFEDIFSSFWNLLK